MSLRTIAPVFYRSMRARWFQAASEMSSAEWIAGLVSTVTICEQSNFQEPVEFARSPSAPRQVHDRDSRLAQQPWSTIDRSLRSICASHP